MAGVAAGHVIVPYDCKKALTGCGCPGGGLQRLVKESDYSGEVARALSA